MADARTAVDDLPAAHADHDLLLVAEAADRGGELPVTLAACTECRTLHADLVALAAAVPTAALPARPRTYTLSQADADRLRASGWRRWLGAIGSSRDAISRPLALGFTTIGLAGLLVATVPGALPSGGATGAAPSVERYESLQVAASAAPGDGAATVGGTEPAATQEDTQPAAPFDALLVASMALFLVGLGVFGVRRLATRGRT